MTQSEFLRELSTYTHFTLADLMNRANRLREADMLSRGGRGLSAAKINAAEAADIVLAALSGVSANTCPEATRKLKALENDNGRLGDTLTEILSDPVKADAVKSFMVDRTNNRAAVSWVDGREEAFGATDDFNSGEIVFLHGRVLRILHCAMLEPTKADYDRMKEAFRIAKEQGNEAALEWLKKQAESKDQE